VAAVAFFAGIGGTDPVRAADIIADWPSVKLPPPPELKPVTLDGKTTALLVLDVMKENCGVRPRCPDTVPKIKALLDRARAAGALVACTLPNGGSIIDPSIAPLDGEIVEQKPGGPDKFLGSDLDQRLKARGIKTVIIRHFGARRRHRYRKRLGAAWL
jgi:hypothetical protein